MPTLVLVFMMTSGMWNVSDAVDWRDEIAQQITKQKHEFPRLDAEVLRIRVNSKMLTVSTREALSELIESLREDCTKEAFFGFCGGILRDSDKYEKPFSEVHVILAGQNSREERKVPLGNGRMLQETQATKSGANVTTRIKDGRAQSIVTDAKSAQHFRIPSMNDLRFVPTFDVSRYSLAHQTDETLALELKAESEDFQVLFDRKTGLVAAYSISETTNGQRHPVLDIWQLGSIEVSPRIFLPKLFAKAQYTNGELSTVHVTWISNATIPQSIEDSAFDSSVPAGTVVADLRGDAKQTVPKFVTNGPVEDLGLRIIELEQRPTAPQVESSSVRMRLVLLLNIAAIIVLGCAVFVRRRSSDKGHPREERKG